MKFNHTKWLEKIYIKRLENGTQTRIWLSRFSNIYFSQNIYK